MSGASALASDLAHAQLMNRIEHLARRALPAFGLNPAARLTLLNHSENTTFRVDDPVTGDKTVLRGHRRGYHTKNAIRCELQWMAALRRDTDVFTPRPVAGADGEFVQTIAHPELPEPRNCVLFEFVDGHEPSEDQLVEPFKVLGETCARMHLHVEGWALPENFERLHWDFEHMLGPRPNWGHWRDVSGLDCERTGLLGRLVATIERRMAGYGKACDRFGLIHADVRLSNLLVDGNETRIIDFDDSGFGWFLYDLETALSFMEQREDVPNLIAAWLEGYTRIRDVSQQDLDEIPTFLMLRRMVILAWCGSHAETDLAKQLGAEYTTGTCRLAEDYLRKFG